MLAIPELTGADVVFGNVKHMPKMADIPEIFHRRNGTQFNDAVSMWFFKGGKRDGRSITIGSKTFTAKEGVDATKALSAIKAVLGSFEPKHEHKMAACAYMLSEWFDLEPAVEK